MRSGYEAIFSKCSQESTQGAMNCARLDFSQFCLIVKAIAYSRNGQDEARAFWKRFDLLAQLGYVDVEAVRSRVGFNAPEFF